MDGRLESRFKDHDEPSVNRPRNSIVAAKRGILIRISSYERNPRRVWRKNRFQIRLALLRRLFVGSSIPSEGNIVAEGRGKIVGSFAANWEHGRGRCMPLALAWIPRPKCAIPVRSPRPLDAPDHLGVPSVDYKMQCAKRSRGDRCRWQENQNWLCCEIVMVRDPSAALPGK
jgi:hypothetical protein